MKTGERKYLSGKGVAAPDTGAMLASYIKEHRIYQAALARTLERHINTLVKYKKSHSIQTAILWELCHALQHNFFADLAEALPDTFTGALAGLKAGHLDTIERMEETIEKLQQENGLLRELLRERR